jgi:nucleolar protein 6
MSVAQKLTKKQKKSIAFRERGKTSAHPKHSNEEEDNAIPVVELQDIDEVRDTASVTVVTREGGKEGESKGEKKRKAGISGENEKILGKGKGKAVEAEGKGVKRKREVKDDHEGYEEEKVGEGQFERKAKRPKEGGQDSKGVPKRKKLKRTEGDAEDLVGGDNSLGKQRLILFVGMSFQYLPVILSNHFAGNLKYTTSLDSIKSHFSTCDPPPTIRLLTPKPNAKSKVQTSKSKGCAFLEFSKHAALQQALRLHQSELEGRKINVELTAGGGGKSEKRLSKVKERNKELHGQRVSCVKLTVT